jgi:formate hydrogenlyase transcriptional activator
MYHGELMRDTTQSTVCTASDGDTQAMRRQFMAERDDLQLLLNVTNALAFHVDARDLVVALSSALRRAIPHAFMGLALHEAGSDALVLEAAAFRSPDGQQNGHDQLGRRLPLVNSPSGVALRARCPLVVHDYEFARFAEVLAPLSQRGIRALCCVPLLVRDRALGTLEIGSLKPEAFTPAALTIIDDVARLVAIAVANMLAVRELAQLKDKLGKERLSFQGEIPVGDPFVEQPFDDIIGGSRPLRTALRQVEIVAPTDSTVLVLGETGTGKELIARAIHKRSSRGEGSFVKLNCAAMPSGLLESELFGHERGAFTGAITQKLGRFEEAHRGTLFLDEIGEIPLELQPKLLRVVQDQEFVRVGGTRTIKVDVRLIAATNRDLIKMVEEQRFRDDLYYRLNVFPICCPPLRDRPEDIEPLVRHFVQRFAARMHRRIEVIPTEALDAMRRYSWPGNVRELQNLIERAVILSSGSRLATPLAHATRRPASMQDEHASTLEVIERAHIARVLEETNWVVGGRGGAAVRLGIKRTTLQAMMKRFAIGRPAPATTASASRANPAASPARICTPA